MSDEPKLCPCFPGNCRGGQVINGFTVVGDQCRAYEHVIAPHIKHGGAAMAERVDATFVHDIINDNRLTYEGDKVFYNFFSDVERQVVERLIAERKAAKARGDIDTAVQIKRSLNSRYADLASMNRTYGKMGPSAVHPLYSGGVVKEHPGLLPGEVAAVLSHGKIHITPAPTDEKPHDMQDVEVCEITLDMLTKIAADHWEAKGGKRTRKLIGRFSWNRDLLGVPRENYAGLYAALSNDL